MLNRNALLIYTSICILLCSTQLQAAASSSAAASSQEAFNALKETYLKAIENNDIDYAKRLYEELQEIDPAQAGQLHPESPSFGKQSPLPSGASHSAAASGASSSSAAASSTTASAVPSIQEGQVENYITLESSDGYTVKLPTRIAKTYSIMLRNLLEIEDQDTPKQKDPPIKLTEFTGIQLTLVVQLMMEADRLSRLEITDQTLIDKLTQLIDLSKLAPETIEDLDITKLSIGLQLRMAAFMSSHGQLSLNSELFNRLKQSIIDKQLVQIMHGLLLLDAPLLLEAAIQAFINNIEQTETKRKAIIARKKNSLSILSETAQSMLYAYNIRLKPDGYSIRELSDKGVPLSRDMSNMNINSLDGIELLSSINYWTLNLSNNSITTIPTDIKGLKNVMHLHLDNNNITTIPTDIKGLENVMHLYLNNNNITTIPTHIEGLRSLFSLDLANNNITEIPTDIKGLPLLQTLDLRGNPIQATPEERAQLKKSLPKAKIYWPDGTTSMLINGEFQIRQTATNEWLILP